MTESLKMPVGKLLDYLEPKRSAKFTMWQWFFGLALALISMATPKRALFIGAIFFLVTATINVSLLPVHSTTSCPSSTTDFFLISLEKNSFKSNSYFMWQSTTTWRTKRLLVIAKVRRTQHACALYCNSTLTFWRWACTKSRSGAKTWKSSWVMGDQKGQDRRSIHVVKPFKYNCLH